MDYDSIFAEYYPMYRGQATVPASSDREYQLGIPFANNAIRRWDRADGTLWEELYTTNQIQGSEGEGSLTVDTTQPFLNGPTNMRKPGGVLKLINPTNANDFRKIPVVLSSEKYAQGGSSTFANFVGSANTGIWALYLNGDYSQYANWLIDYDYYKTPTLFTNGGGEVADMSDPNFIIQTMLQTRFVNSRNGFAYSDAKAEATNSLRNMVIENNSGSPGNSWNLLSTDQTPGFAQSNRNTFFGRQ